MFVNEDSCKHIKFLYGATGKVLAQVVQKSDNTIYRINHFPAVSVVCFVRIAIYPVKRVIQPLNNWSLFTSYHDLGMTSFVFVPKACQNFNICVLLIIRSLALLSMALAQYHTKLKNSVTQPLKFGLTRLKMRNIHTR